MEPILHNRPGVAVGLRLPLLTVLLRWPHTLPAPLHACTYIPAPAHCCACWTHLLPDPVTLIFLQVLVLDCYLIEDKVSIEKTLKVSKDLYCQFSCIWCRLIFRKALLRWMCILAILTWMSGILVVFNKFSPLCYGSGPMNASQILELKLRETWDFIIHKPWT